MWKKRAGSSSRRRVSACPQAAPKATLLINDYRTDPAFERVIEKLVDAQGKRLYDVIGIQSHMHGGTWTNGKIQEVCERFARFGVPLHFTETTILSGATRWERKRGLGPTPEGEAVAGRAKSRGSTRCSSPTRPSRRSPGGTSPTTTPGKAPRRASCGPTCRPSRPTTGY